jgi:hypothetical protein
MGRYKEGTSTKDVLANEIQKTIVKQLNNLEIRESKDGTGWYISNRSVVTRALTVDIEKLYHSRINIKMRRKDGFLEDSYGIKNLY